MTSLVRRAGLAACAGFLAPVRLGERVRARPDGAFRCAGNRPRASAVTAIVGGDGRSMLVAAALPVASGSAFLISEFAGYAPLQQCRLILAVGAVPCLDLAVGSVVLLLLAFARPHLLLGQVLGKLWAGTVSLRFTRRLLRRLAPTPG